MKSDTSLKGRNAIYGICVSLGFVCWGAAALCPESYAASGVLSVIGLLSYVAGGKTVRSREEAIILFTAFWMGLGARLSTVLGISFGSRLIMFGIALPVSALISISFAAERKLRARGHGIPALLCFPLFYTATMMLVEVLNFSNIPNFMTYIMCLPILCRNMAIVNEPVMTALLAIVFSLIAEAMTASRRNDIIVCGVTALMIVSCLLISGFILRAKETDYDYTLSIAVATPEKMDMNGLRDREYTEDELEDIFIHAVRTASEKDADLLVMSEEFCTIDYANLASSLTFYQSIIREYGIPVIVTMDIGGTPSGQNINQALYIDRNGEIQAEYIKSNLVPFVEDGYYQKGGGNPECLTVELGGHTVNLVCIICFDLNNSAFVTGIPAQTELLIAPSWDWDTCNMEQKRLTFRSAELETTLLKHTYEGFSYVSDPYGTCREMLDMRGAYEAVEIMEVPIWEK